MTTLLGRDAKVRAVVDLLGSHRLVTLTGPGGVGKTRLAIEAARAVAPSFADGVAFVDLVPVRDPTVVPATIARALDVREAPGHSPDRALAAAIGERRLLLVLDNLEQVVEAAVGIAALLEACPRLAVIATSRAALSVRGERVVPLDPLPVPPEGTSPVDLTASPAVGLFAERAAEARPGFELSDANAPTVAAICARLDGLPLAIELAAARVRMSTPEAILAKLANRLPLLTGGARDLPDRQRTLRGAIAWSHDLLSPEEQVMFRRLAVFAGGSTLEAAEAVASPDGLVDTIDVLAALVDKSLVRQEVANGEPRFRMLGTVREYAAERLEEAGEGEAVRRAHAAHYAAFAEAVAARVHEVPDPTDVLGRVEAEHDNLRAALAWAAERDEAVTLARLVGALCDAWKLLGRYSEARGWIAAALTVVGAVPRPLRAAVLLGAAWAARFQGDLGPAEALGREGLALARDLGDALAVVNALSLLGFVAEDLGEFARSKGLHEEALAIARPLDHPFWTSLAIRDVGWLALLGGDTESAERLLDEALTRLRRDGYRRQAALVLSDLSEVALRRGDLAQAAALYQERLHLIGDSWSLRWSLEGLAAIATGCGEAARAARLFGAAETLRERLGAVLVPSVLPAYGANVATVRAALGEVAFEEAWQAGRRMGPEDARSEAELVGKGVDAAGMSGGAAAPETGPPSRQP